ncbi:hypothetical protein [Nocardia huaxiensis]|uniref:Uncharacterized protein n=1 Tax=Nocardia huaxiensis TaxID=2755382 RepID=A0A7D6YZH0_9NOCA|nr:hypothetical protein [Nocardia huaxiensis]QLY28386.1 hypothetical protein H0264_23780 [Nocardia huaxiensis]UFS98162.1 hypothetical protein LPY97_09825 [Nocardia huaxiensis]
MVIDHTSGFTVEDVTVGRYAHGFGTTGDGRSFAFRTVRSTLRLEIYRPDLDSDVPAPEDVVAVAEAPVTDIDLDDERSVIALVRDLVPQAEAVAAAPAPPVAGREVTVRALLGRLGAVIDGM